MTDSPVKCKSFVSEAEIEVRKQKRQEEWEKVRKPDDPLEAPEEEYDPRTLYDRLQEQKDLRQAEVEESRRLKNLIKGLDDDEVAFLELVDQTKIEMETKLWQEENKEIQEFRRAVSHLTEEEREAKLQHFRRTLNLQSAGSPKKSQYALLAGALKRKASHPAAAPEKKPTLSPVKVDSMLDKASNEPVKSSLATSINRNMTNTISCLGVLPGLGAYSDSSDSENSSDSDVEKSVEYDLFGRSLNIQNAP